MKLNSLREAKSSLRRLCILTLLAIVLVSVALADQIQYTPCCVDPRNAYCLQPGGIAVYPTITPACGGGSFICNNDTWCGYSQNSDYTLNTWLTGYWCSSYQCP
jgi:hypothetical protein